MPVTFTAGYIEVWRDGAMLSRHRVEREAVEAILAAETDGDYEIRTAPVKVNVKRKIIGPDAPALGPVLTISSTALTVTLDRPATGPTRIDRYELERWSGSAWVQIASGTSIFGAGNAYPDTGLLPSTAYSYRCRAIDTTDRASEYSSGTGITSSGAANQAPVWDGVVSVSIQAGQSASIASFCTDPEGTPLTFTRTDSDPTGVTVSPSGVVSVDSAVAPSAGYTITVQASDGLLTTNKDISLTVTAEFSGTYTIYDNFDASTLNSANFQKSLNGSLPGTDITVVTDQYVSSSRGMKSSISGLTTGDYRAEVQDTLGYNNSRAAVFGQDHWYGLAIMLPVGWVQSSGRDTCCQWHHRNWLADSLTMSPASPIISIQVRDGLWKVTNRWTDQPRTYYGATSGTLPTSAFNAYRAACDANQTEDVGQAINPGVWQYFVVRVNWAWTTAGILQIWQNGSLIVNRVGAPNCSYENTSIAPYWKFGNYRVANKTTATLLPRTVYFDNARYVKTGGSFAAVDPSTT